MNLFLVPASEDNIKTSIEDSVASKFLEENLSSEKIADIRQAYGEKQPVHCWAMTEGKRATFEKMQSGDVVLITVKGTGKFKYMGVVALTMECPAKFGNSLWPVTPNEPWTLVYFLRDVTKINVDKSRLVTALGYKPNFPVYGAIRVQKNQLDELIRAYGSIPKAIGSIQAGDLELVAHAQTTPSEEAVAFVRPPELNVLIQNIELLRNDPKHQERAHEALVEEFYGCLGYIRFADIKHRQGRIDVSVEVEGRTRIVNEVKRSWGLSRSDQKAIDQGYR